jgi:hypothetical protein
MHEINSFGTRPTFGIESLEQRCLFTDTTLVWVTVSDATEGATMVANFDIWWGDDESFDLNYSIGGDIDTDDIGIALSGSIEVERGPYDYAPNKTITLEIPALADIEVEDEEDVTVTAEEPTGGDVYTFGPPPVAPPNSPYQWWGTGKINAQTFATVGDTDGNNTSDGDTATERLPCPRNQETTYGQMTIKDNNGNPVLGEFEFSVVTPAGIAVPNVTVTAVGPLAAPGGAPCYSIKINPATLAAGGPAPGSYNVLVWIKGKKLTMWPDTIYITIP